MSVTVSTIAEPLGTKLVIDLNSNATAEDDVTGAATTIYAVEIDNTENNAATYVKLADVADATSGTTAPGHQFMVPGSTKLTFVIGGGIPISTKLSFWSVISPYATTANDANSTESPASVVPVKVLCT
jgi:thiamine biosynthesis lipoprotein ApbE